MTPLDTELFNEFKRLDNLLRDSRGTERGVSDYIDDMKAVSSNESRYVLNWRRDLDRLWHCRHIRNKLAHDATSEEYPLCDPENVEFLKEFYTRVLNGTDPLAQLKKHRQKADPARAASTTRPTPPPRTYTYSPRTTAPQEQGCLSCLVWTVVTALAIPCVAAIIGLLTQ